MDYPTTSMEYKRQKHPRSRFAPRLIIHGGAGNVTPATVPPEKRKAYREALFTIVTKTNAYMTSKQKGVNHRPTALETATFAVALFEDNPLFNSGHGAVFTRDGINELEASVMVSRGFAKRAAAVAGLRHVRNPILLARSMLEHGDADLATGVRSTAVGLDGELPETRDLDVPSARGHTIVYGEAAETLARMYGHEMVEPEYFFTQNRWDEHVRGLERERRGGGVASWSSDEYLPQGTVGAIALDEDGVVCCATSTGGLTNKLTGRVGDTPVPGAGFWAEEWQEARSTAGVSVGQNPSIRSWEGAEGLTRSTGSSISLSETLKGLMADCLPMPFAYTPIFDRAGGAGAGLSVTRSMAFSGTGNGDSFLRTAAVRTVASMARFGGVSGRVALKKVAGPSGELQESAGDRWGKTGEGEGGIIGIECVAVRDNSGNLVETRSEILQDLNCGGMFRAWIGDDGEAEVRIWRE